jgi:hypothetical protein
MFRRTALGFVILQLRSAFDGDEIMYPLIRMLRVGETLAFSLVFGSLLGWLLSTPRPAAEQAATPAA